MYSKFNSIYIATISDIFSIAVISSLTFLIATIVRATGFAIIASVIVYFSGLVGGNLLSASPIYKYILTPNLSLSVYLPGEKLPFEGATLEFSFIVCLAYLAIFLSSGLIIFIKRDVY